MVTNQGEEAQELSKERRSRWISAISHDDLTKEILENDRLCEKNFVSGRAAKSWDKYIIDGFRHCSWDTKKLLIEHTIKKRRQNEARERGNVNL